MSTAAEVAKKEEEALAKQRAAEEKKKTADKMEAGTIRIIFTYSESVSTHFSLPCNTLYAHRQ
jgi:ribosomal protein S25